MSLENQKIIAIGGGEIGREGFPVETTSIDKEIISLTGTKKPKLLFIPTASGDSSDYCSVVRKHFGEALGCDVSHLLLSTDLSSAQIRESILSADIIYVGGGNTLRMMTVWRKLGVDEILREARDKGIVLSGLSAGAICWFRHGSSDSRRFTSDSTQFIRVCGLGFVPLLFCPHYDVESDRKKDLKRMMKRTSGVAVACENSTALKIVGDSYVVLRSKPSAKAYKCYWKRGKFVKLELFSGLVRDLVRVE